MYLGRVSYLTPCILFAAPVYHCAPTPTASARPFPPAVRLQELVRIAHAPFVKTFTFRRLGLLEARFGLHVQLNAERELAESKTNPHRDFYNVRKVSLHTGCCVSRLVPWAKSYVGPRWLRAVPCSNV